MDGPVGSETTSRLRREETVGEAGRIGLGCSRLGSFGTNDGTDPETILMTAAELGIRFFDTADIYGQGDSERLIGKFMRANAGHFVVCTKVGQYFPWYFKPAFLVKGTIKLLLRRAGGTSAVRAARSRVLPRNFSASYLERKVSQSLKRLQMQSVDIVMLHSPPAEVISEGSAISTLYAIKLRGAARAIGVACDDRQTLDAALDDKRIDAVQVTLDVLQAVDAGRLRHARARGLTVIAREIFGGARPAGSAPLPPEFVRDRLLSAVSHPNVDIVLIGTTNAGRLRRLVRDYRDSRNAGVGRRST